jgi:hypothetical protein
LSIETSARSPADIEGMVYDLQSARRELQSAIVDGTQFRKTTGWRADCKS